VKWIFASSLTDRYNPREFGCTPYPAESEHTGDAGHPQSPSKKSDEEFRQNDSQLVVACTIPSGIVILHLAVDAQETAMPAPSRRSKAISITEPGTLLAALAARPQIEFETELYEAILAKRPDFEEVLEAQAENYALQGRYQDGLCVDERLVSLRPHDPTVHYNLARGYARLQDRDRAISTLRRAVELGFRDAQAMTRDENFASLRKDPRFRQIVRECTSRPKR
jgi:hypothetical protein